MSLNSVLNLLVSSEADITRLAPSKLVELSQPGAAVLVASGSVDLFMRGQQSSSGESFLTPAGRLSTSSILAVGPHGRYEIVARPHEHASVFQVGLDALESLGSAAGDNQNADFAINAAVATAQLAIGLDAAQADIAAGDLGSVAPSDFEPLPRSSSIIAIPEGIVMRSISGVTWVKVADGQLTLMSLGASTLVETGGWVCLTERDAIRAEVATTVSVMPTLELLRASQLKEAEESWHETQVAILDAAVTAKREAQLRGSTEAVIAAQRSAEALDQEILPRLLSSDVQVEQTTEKTRRAINLVLAANGIQTDAAIDIDSEITSIDDVRSWLRRIGLFSRDLRIEGVWTKRLQSAVIGQRRGTNEIVAVLPHKRGVRILAPQDDGSTVVVPKDELLSTAIEVHDAPPADVERVGQLYRWALDGASGGVSSVLMPMILGAALGLVVPVIMGRVVGQWAASGNLSMIRLGAAAVLAAGVFQSLLGYAQNVLALRLQGQVDARAQTGTWLRMLALKPIFFRQHSAGDLATVSLGVANVREVVSNTALRVMLAAITAVLNLGLVVWVSWRAALVVLGVSVIVAVLAWITTRVLIRLNSTLYQADRSLTALTYEILTANASIRAAAANGRVYSRWLDAFLEVRYAALRVRRWYGAAAIIGAATVPVMLIALFVALASMVSDLGPAHVVTAFVAGSTVAASLSAVVSMTAGSAELVPTLSELDVILGAEPDSRPHLQEAPRLAGALSVQEVSFSYAPETPEILSKVSFEVHPGDFVALVGGSGAGKSTMLRLLLGFERPTHGSIRFDNVDMQSVQIESIRSQIGVVLQGSELFPGDIFQNITGGAAYTLDDAWAAADLVGLKDFISQLPMGMFTHVSETGSTFSGGQSQRVLLARALIGRPAYVFLDEATSALDNQSQAQVAKSLADLNATRVVVAHRLSTIRQADRILVFDGGQIVEQGTYDELVAIPDGVFADLVRKQQL